MKESELAKHFIDFFSDHDVYQEVQCGGIIDIVAVKANVITAIEVKCSLNFEVIEQAHRNRSSAHYSYIAVPAPKNTHFGYHICKEFGIGVLTYREKHDFRGNLIQQVQQVVKPAFNRRIHKPELHHWQKESVAGSQNERMTSFKNTVREIGQELLSRGGKSLIAEIFRSNRYHYSSLTTCKLCIVKMCDSGVIKEFRRDGAHLVLNQ